MIELLGPRPHDKVDEVQEAMLGHATPRVIVPPVSKPSGGKTAPLTLGEGIEAGGGIPVPHPVGIEAGVATTKAPKL